MLLTNKIFLVTCGYMIKQKEQFVHYDQEADVLALYAGKGKEEEFVEVAPNVSVELDKAGSVIGVEILNASKVLRPFLSLLKKRQTIAST